MTPPQSGPTATEDSVIDEIVTTVSRAEGIDATDLSPPLADVIDTDALVGFVANADGPASVTFSYRDRVVEVRSGDGGDVTVRSDDR